MPAMAGTKVFLLGGQSNMAGVGGYDSPLPAPYDSPQPEVRFWNYDPQIHPEYDFNVPGVGTGWVDLESGYGHLPTNFGPEITFGYTLKNMFPDDDIYLIKEGLTSQDLAVQWNSDGTGPIYNIFKSRVDAAMQNLTDAGLAPTIAGMIWMQGESDAMNHSYAIEYETNLTNLIADVRSDFSTPEMPFVIGRILPYYGTPADNATVRDAQESVAVADENVTWIDTDDLSLAYAGHYGTQGQIELGTRFALEFGELPIPYHFPNKASMTFDYRYEMNVDPTDVTQINLDAGINSNTTADWENAESTTAVLNGGIMAMSNDTTLISGSSAGNLWPNIGFTGEEGFTFEISMKTVGGSAGATTSSLILCLSDSSEFGMLTVAPDRCSWIEGPSMPCVNDNEFHMFRIVRDSDDNGGLWWVWRDDELLTPEGTAKTGELEGLDRVYFGPGISPSYVGSLEVDFVRLTEGAFGPVEKIPGDANGDGQVDGSDVTILAGNWQKGVSDGLTASWEEGDFNGDGQVDGSDVTILAGNWQHGVAAENVAVPEPNTFVLLASMVGSLWLLLRRGSRFLRSLPLGATCLVVAACFIATCDAATEPAKVDVFVNGDGYNVYRIPSLLCTPKGTLLAFCEGRLHGDQSPTDMVLKRSTDGGKTWLPMQVIDKAVPEAVMNPTAMFDRATDTIILTYCRFPEMPKGKKLGEFTRRPGLGRDSVTVWMITSKDEGKTWSKPCDITIMTKKSEWIEAAPGPGVGIQLRSGRLVAPCFQSQFDERKDETRMWGIRRCYAIFSDDHGKTWQLGDGETGPDVNETQVVELTDGTLLMNMRSADPRKGCRIGSISKDQGQTWSALFDIPELPDPCCQASILRYTWADKSGSKSRILYAAPGTKQGRHTGTVRVSYDEAKTWPVSKVIWKDYFGYCCLTTMPDDKIGCLFELAGCRKIAFISFSLEWLTDGKDFLK